MKTKRRKVLSLFLALILSVSALPFSRLTAFAVTSGNFEYSVISETDKTCEITKYTGSDAVLNIPSQLDGYIVTGIGNSAFSGCSSLTDITIPNSVTSIGDCAFFCCTSLTSVTIPKSVTNIGAQAFQECTSLTSITIPGSVTSIGDGAFAGCTLLQNIEVDAKNSVYSSVDGVMFNKKQTELICYPAGKSNTSYTVPESVTNIANYAFCLCPSLTNVIIPDGVATIGEGAFLGCTSLTSITISNGVTNIGGWSFSGCTALTNITIPDTVTSIGDYAFSDCASLTSITIPDSVTEIGYAAFVDCTSLASITIPDNMINIASDAFNGTAYYNTESNWENDVLYIGNRLIKARNTLGGDYTVKQGTKAICGGAFSGCASLTGITMPDSVTCIDSNAFFVCTALTNITIPDSVTNIGNYAFYNCASLTSITIPNSVTSMGDYAFYYCTSLTSVIISDSVTNIGDYAFEGCEKIKILGFDNSAAKTYAENNSIEFCLMGDVDGNGAYESNDYSMLVSQIFCQKVDSVAPMEVGDINLDGAVDGFDAVQLDLYLNGTTDIHGNKIA